MGQMYFPDEEPSNGNRWGWVSGILIAACLLWFAYPYINLPSWLKDLPFYEELFVDTSDGDCLNDSAQTVSITVETEDSAVVDYSNLRKIISEWESLRIAAVTDTDEGVIVYGINGFACHNAPDGLHEKLHNINSKKQTITDVNVIDGLSYVVIVGKNGFSAKGAPPSFIKKLREYNERAETIFSASFNSKKDWAIITNKHYSWSNEDIRDFCSVAQEKYGNIKYMFISDSGKVACCERGVYYRNLPSNVEQAIHEYHRTPSIIKFTDAGRYAITTSEGYYRFKF